MIFEGACYCGSVRYRAEGEPILEGQCHCRECQYITGGEPNAFIAIPLSGLTYNQGKSILIYPDGCSECRHPPVLPDLWHGDLFRDPRRIGGHQGRHHGCPLGIFTEGRHFHD